MIMMILEYEKCSSKGPVMRKKSISILLAAVMTALCACGANSQEDKGMGAENSNEEISMEVANSSEESSVATDNSSEDLSSFASGIKTEDDSEGADTEFVLNDEIDERCPLLIESKRGDV
jgi:hypothetical protein